MPTYAERDNPRHIILRARQRLRSFAVGREATLASIAIEFVDAKPEHTESYREACRTVRDWGPYASDVPPEYRV